MTRKQLTLCIIHEHPRVLLGMKKRGFGEGRWNGFGGKVDAGETIEDAARREVLEECGVSVGELKKRGVLEFSFERNPEEILEVHIFKAEHFEGTPEETEEMKPEWFTVASIPYTEMWPDDIHWMPLFFAGKCFKGSFHFGEGDTILKSALEEIPEE
ncbi:hypothetical protein A3C89_00805 [Candidatus Kaiserbacteria bacterium RIFCSPHIGHO2_02_FULL_50_50]|uniref:Oxidized purine nucleoside triphosphate hydrolase n=1 Tax=Candidatus Kaiserbacteria bacterium RIFCSPHIGHO2_02_FULL_50_50 TaxID=1798492 RepID=A0A1F6DFS4_9BACT|nr:MAG: hypothetical protein A3C89_00805 [Candidatus Kaiserbacteria bacterium RIFCSPHIGHO2_02_FULL_50_50]OGG88886.1 MAG: hypothetical protein A3G62_03245 [Candidatus Kaiserbacteria bacterium RIFCSPLOWO2_12_FULL_50_10]